MFETVKPKLKPAGRTLKIDLPLDLLSQRTELEQLLHRFLDKKKKIDVSDVSDVK